MNLNDTLNDVVFDIKGLKCSYDGVNMVLNVEYLQIPRGKLIVLLGKSGSGKSTFLETLGLMNNTILNGEISFYPDNDTMQPIELAGLWKNNHLASLSGIRNKHMSFIFQNTNLMPNFSALENICISRLIQGSDFKTASREAIRHMKTLGIDVVNDGRMSVNLSGGQKQRVAFVRAISSSFDVLFGDEPTGNLDEFNTGELMDVLAGLIRSESKTAIIVSHNIDIALKYADQIIIISKDNNNGSGFILPNNILTRKTTSKIQWLTPEGNVKEDPKLFIMRKMNA